MNNQANESKTSANQAFLPDWLAGNLIESNGDFEQRVVSLPEFAQWQATGAAGVQLRVLEYMGGTNPRLAAQLRFSQIHDPISIKHNPGMELLIQRGELTSELGSYAPGAYFRLPSSSGSILETQRFYSGKHLTSNSPLLYLAAGQMSQSDTEHRIIDTLDEERWLPGPTDGTEVLPLHGHSSENVMLIRWTGNIAFKPRLDPQGEEILVLHGMIHDALGSYPAGSWIRNPVESWQSWGARSGTLVYYKNGHFGQ